MTENVQVSTEFLKKVKNAIELIYEITQEEYHGGFKNEKTLIRKVATAMVKKGSVIKTGDRRSATYKWNPIAMKPTNLFIATIAEEIVEQRRKKWNNWNKKKDNQQIINEMNNNDNEKKDACMVVETPSIEKYTIEELWYEIKRKGGYIKDNKLAYTTFID